MFFDLLTSKSVTSSFPKIKAPSKTIKAKEVDPLPKLRQKPKVSTPPALKPAPKRKLILLEDSPHQEFESDTNEENFPNASLVHKKKQK